MDKAAIILPSIPLWEAICSSAELGAFFQMRSKLAIAWLSSKDPNFATNLAMDISFTHFAHGCVVNQFIDFQGDLN